MVSIVVVAVRHMQPPPTTVYAQHVPGVNIVSGFVNGWPLGCMVYIKLVLVSELLG